MKKIAYIHKQPNDPESIQCTECKCVKDPTEFHWHKRSGRDSICAECSGTKCNNERGREQKRLVLEAKSVPCADCGILWPPEAVDMDHIPKLMAIYGKKKFSLYHCARHTVQAVKDELQKCEAVCASCHRIRTVKRKQWLDEDGISLSTKYALKRRMAQTSSSLPDTTTLY